MQNQVPLHCPFRPQRQLCAPVGMVIQPRIPRASQMFLVLHPLTTDIRNGIYYLVYTITNTLKRICNYGKTQDIQPTGAGRSVLAH